MDPRTQSSFIPKKPVTESGFSPSGGISLFSLSATIIFVVAIAASLGLFGYNYFLKKDVSNLETELEVAQKTFDPELIASLARVDSRMKNAKEILQNHVSVSAVFDALEVLTAEPVRFKTFEFGNSNGDSLDVALEGVAKTFNAVTFQSDVFRSEKAIKNPIFYDLALDTDGNVGFKVKMSVDPTSILYKTNLITVEEPSAQVQNAPPVASVIPSASTTNAANATSTH